MAEALKILAQRSPAAATQETLYTAPSQVAAPLLTVCNRSATATSFRVRVNVAGVADDDKQFLFYDHPIAGNETITYGPLALGVGDLVKVYATLATLSFTLTGVEVA